MNISILVVNYCILKIHTDGLTYFIVLLSFLYRKTVIHSKYPNMFKYFRDTKLLLKQKNYQQ